MEGQCSIDSMGTQIFLNYCSLLLTLYGYEVCGLFSFPYLLVLMCVHCILFSYPF